MMMDASADTDATDETENAYLRIVERTFAVFPEFGMDAQETSAAANLLYAGDAPEMGLLLLSYGENGVVLVRWFAENGCVCLTAIPVAHQATELTTDKLSEFYAGEFEEVDLSRTAVLAELEPHQPDEDTIRQLSAGDAALGGAERRAGGHCPVEYSGDGGANQHTRLRCVADDGV